jgi:hypothetical protein
MLGAVGDFLLFTHTKAGQATVKVIYPGSWAGTIFGFGKEPLKSIGGTGTQTFDVEGDIISVLVYRTDGGSEVLTVQVFLDDKLVLSKSEPNPEEDVWVTFSLT